MHLHRREKRPDTLCFYTDKSDTAVTEDDSGLLGDLGLTLDQNSLFGIGVFSGIFKYSFCLRSVKRPDRLCNVARADRTR